MTIKEEWNGVSLKLQCSICNESMPITAVSPWNASLDELNLRDDFVNAHEAKCGPDSVIYWAETTPEARTHVDAGV